MIHSHPHNNLFRIRLGLLIIILSGLFVRVYHLGTESLWIDEAYSIGLAKSSLSQLVTETSGDVHPPLYYILLHYWISFFGSSEFSVRFMSVIFSVLSIFVIYKVGSLIYDRNVGLLSALILAFSVYHIHYSQETRMYSQIVLFALLSMCCMIKYEKEKRSISAIGYVVFTACLIYSHIYGLFILIAQNIYMTTRFFLDTDYDKSSLKNWILLQISIIILFAPWIVILIRQVIGVHSEYWISSPSIRKIAAPLLMYSGSWALFLFFVSLSCISAGQNLLIKSPEKWQNYFKSFWKRHRTAGSENIWEMYLLLVWLSVPIILPFLISRFFTPILMTRYTIVASLAFYLLISKVVYSLSPGILRAFCMIIVFLLSLSNISAYYKSVNKPQWRDVALHIDKASMDSDLIILHKGFCLRSFDYYSKKSELRKVPFPKNDRAVTKENLRDLDETIQGYNRVWLIMAYEEDASGIILQRLKSQYTEIDQREYVSSAYATGKRLSINVFLFQRK